ncbi:MAG: AMP-binding protein [Actinomycetota bacterium]|nr:AMP-binding protein [Actinomycetota bacterium]
MSGSPYNLAAVLEARAAGGGWSGDVAFLAGERVVTHAGAHDGAARAASLLTALGVGRGDRVLIAVPDGVEFVWAFLGAVRAGAVAVPVNPRLTAADHRAAAIDAGARMVVCSTDLAERFEDRVVVTADELESAFAGRPPLPPADMAPGDAAYAQYTSGTTGSPKAAVHAHGDPLVYFEAFALPAIAVRRADVLLSVSKLYFAYGLGNSLFFPLLAGCRAVLDAAHPRPDDIAELVRRRGVTVLFSVPTFYAHLVASGRPEAFATVRAAVSAGEALNVALAERARKLLDCPILDGLGSTEVGQTFASNTLAHWRDGTVGRALPPYRVCVRDGRGRTLAPGRPGVLWVSGPTLPLGYLGPPARLAVPGTGDATGGEWLCTGDRAELDGDGFVHLRGRVDDLEMVGGISVSPLEIEAVLSRHPAVTEVAVAGVLGPDGASRLAAFVVPATPAATGTLVEELVALARSELAPFKVPRSVLLVEALPRTPTGKLRRFVLRNGTWGAQAVGPRPAPQPVRSPKRVV